MRKHLLTAALALALTATQSQAKEEPKTGTNFGFLPTISYSSDLGFQYGAQCQMFYYGDGSAYPAYLHKLDVEISRYTKGTSVLHAFYDSKHLIPGLRVTAAASFIGNKMYPFYGFNGTASPWSRELDANKESGIAFYNTERNMLRLMADFQGRITGSLNWIGGVSFWNYALQDIRNKDYDPQYTLYRRYIDTGLIDPSEAGGGSHLEIKGGVSFDTRDHEAAPDKGISAEAYLYGSPDLFGDHNRNYLKLAAHFRQYLTLVPDRLVFAYHLAYQGLLAGEAPFYTLQNINVLYLRQIHNDGLGSRNTVRGTLYNRFVGNGYAWSNFELRLRLFSFDFIKQHWYVATNPFFDAGKIVQPYKLDQMKEIIGMVSDSPGDLLYTGKDDKLHCSAGAGIKLVMNRNFIISAEFAKTFRAEDGDTGLTIGINYIF